MTTAKNTICLWYDNDAEAAARGRGLRTVPCIAEPERDANHE